MTTSQGDDRMTDGPPLYTLPPNEGRFVHIRIKITDGLGPRQAEWCKKHLLTSRGFPIFAHLTGDYVPPVTTRKKKEKTDAHKELNADTTAVVGRLRSFADHMAGRTGE